VFCNWVGPTAAAAILTDVTDAVSNAPDVTAKEAILTDVTADVSNPVDVTAKMQF